MLLTIVKHFSIKECTASNIFLLVLSVQPLTPHSSISIVTGILIREFRYSLGDSFFVYCNRGILSKKMITILKWVTTQIT
jgi:hypothetical protein